MLHLFCTTASTDWKGRPTHHIGLLGISTNRDELVAKMDEDVRAWQAEELEERRQAAREDALPEPETWEIENERWEMLQEPTENLNRYPQVLREFAWQSDGEFMSMVYHILDMPDAGGP